MAARDRIADQRVFSAVGASGVERSTGRLRLFASGGGIPDVPIQQQRHALLKVAELSLAGNKIAGAVQTLEKYLAQFPSNGVADLATLTLGELQLREALAGGATNSSAPDTNLLSRARTQ